MILAAQAVRAAEYPEFQGNLGPEDKDILGSPGFVSCKWWGGAGRSLVPNKDASQRPHLCEDLVD